MGSPLRGWVVAVVQWVDTVWKQVVWRGEERVTAGVYVAMGHACGCAWRRYWRRYFCREACYCMLNSVAVQQKGLPRCVEAFRTKSA